MALKRRRDIKTWQDIFNLYFIVIISGLLYKMLFVTCEPVSYTRVSLDELNTQIKLVNDDSSEDICWGFASREEVTLGDILNSTCGYQEDNPVTHETDNEAIKCSTTNLPTVSEGSFDCAPNSVVAKGDACNLACNEGFYPASLYRAVCEAEVIDIEGKWSQGSFECRAITCQEVDLPNVNSGFFNCSGYSVGARCNLTCNDDYYPSSSKETICEENIENKANWTIGTFQCTAITCSTTNLPTVSEGSFDCALDTIVSKGKACNLACDKGFYPVYSEQTVCEAGTSDQGGEWSKGILECGGCSVWNQWKGSEYKLISTKDTWEVSRQMCENNSSYLITIDNKAENDFVLKILKYCFRTDPPIYETVFIGLNDIVTEANVHDFSRDDTTAHCTITESFPVEVITVKPYHYFQTGFGKKIKMCNLIGTFEWVDGSVSTYRNWGDDEPYEGAEYTCAVINERFGEWHAAGPSVKVYSVCERNSSLT